MDTCLHMETRFGTPKRAVNMCEEIGATSIVVEDDLQNNYLLEKILLGENDVMPLGCRYIEDASRWRCLDKPVQEWFWFNETTFDGYWSE